VHVGSDVVGRFQAHDATHVDLLANLGDDGGAGFFDRLAGRQLGGLQGVDVGSARAQGGGGNGLGEVQEVGKNT